MHFRAKAELCSWPIHFRPNELFRGDSLIDSDGVEWAIEVVAASKVSLWRRIQHMSRGDQHRTVEVLFKKVGTLSLQKLKDRTFVQIGRDPGDVMMQFVDEENLRAGVSQAGSIQDLIEFLRKAESDEAYSEVKG